MLGVEAFPALESRTAGGLAAVPVATPRPAAEPRRPGRTPPVLQPALKRLFDLAGALGLLAALLPVLLVIAALVRADGGPALFAHERVGRGGRRFGCLKFRSMVVDSAGRLETLLASAPTRGRSGPPRAS